MNKMIQDTYRDWRWQLLIVTVVVFAFTFLKLDSLAPIQYDNLWQEIIRKTAVSLLVTLYFHAANTALHLCALMPLGAAKTMARIILHRLVVPFAVWLVERLKAVKIRRSFTNKRTGQGSAYSLACFFSPRHGAYALHALTQSLLYYA